MLKSKEVEQIRANDRQGVFIGTLVSAVVHLVAIYGISLPEAHPRFFIQETLKFITLRRVKLPPKQLAAVKKIRRNAIERQPTHFRKTSEPAPDEPKPVFDPNPKPVLAVFPVEDTLAFSKPQGPPAALFAAVPGFDAARNPGGLAGVGWDGCDEDEDDEDCRIYGSGSSSRARGRGWSTGSTCSAPTNSAWVQVRRP